MEFQVPESGGGGECVWGGGLSTASLPQACFIFPFLSLYLDLSLGSQMAN